MKKYLSLFVACLTILTSTVLAKTIEDEIITPPSIGETICSPSQCYTIKEKLGAGAFGVVFQAENSEGEQFAIKVNKTNDIHIFSDLEREFEQGQLLDHPNIIKSYEYFQTNNSNGQEIKCLVLQLVDGSTVSRISRRSLPHETVVTILRELNDALSYSLKYDLIFIDLHEGNVMLDKTGKIKLIDLSSFHNAMDTEGLAFLIPMMKTYKKNENAGESIENNPVDEALQPMAKFFQERPALLKNLKKAKKGISQSFSEEIKLFYSYIVSEMSINLLSRSDIGREEKINMYLEIKKLEWNLQEDYLDKNNISLDDFFESLLQIF